MKIPLVLIRSKYQRKLPLARELFLVASREPTVDVRSESQIEQIYSNLFPICLICTDLYDLTSSTVGSARQGTPFLVIILLHIVNIISNRTKFLYTFALQLLDIRSNVTGFLSTIFIFVFLFGCSSSSLCFLFVTCKQYS